jgi:60 kDa SS-A/Ro ribonucleoprotein
VKRSQPHGGTYLGKAMSKLNRMEFDRLIVVTDEQSHDTVPDPRVNGAAYMINVASAKNGVGYGPWVHVDGFSENILRFITEHEAAR